MFLNTRVVASVGKGNGGCGRTPVMNILNILNVAFAELEHDGLAGLIVCCVVLCLRWFVCSLSCGGNGGAMKCYHES